MGAMIRERLLITGAGGFCGLHACKHFRSKAAEVAGALRPSSGDEPRAGVLRRMGVTPVRCDLTDPDAVNRLISDVRPTRILHLAGLNAAGPSWQDPAAYMEANVMATVYLLEAARRFGPDGVRIVAAGSMLRFAWPQDSGGPKPPHPYSFSKTLQTAAVRSWHAMYGMTAVVAEPANLIGPGPSAGLCALIAAHIRGIKKAAAQGKAAPAPFRLSSRHERRDFVDVRDAMAAYELLLERGDPSIVYPIVSGTFRSLGEVADVFTRAAGVPVRWEIGDSAAPSPEAADGSAIRALGWSPAMPFADSIADLLADDADGIAWFDRGTGKEGAADD